MATTIAPKRKRKKPSVLKRIRQTERRTTFNRARKGHLRAQVKRFRQALASGDAARAKALLGETLSILDRSAQAGILHPNTAARTKSRLVVRYNALAAKPSA
jgi:small subunit ribosomal protein S20